MKNIEQELKLQLTEEQYNLLQSYSATQSVLQTNYYFACDGMPCDVMYRLRVKQGKYILCYKKLLDRTNGVFVCDEREAEVDKQFAEQILASGITCAQAKTILGVDVAKDLTCVGSMDTYRTKFDYFGFSLELDRNQYLGTTDYELECECDNVASLAKLHCNLTELFGVAPTPSQPKSQRFWAKLKQ